MPTYRHSVWVGSGYRSVGPQFGYVMGNDGLWHRVAHVWVKLEDGTWGDAGAFAAPTQTPGTPTLTKNTQSGATIMYQLLVNFTPSQSYGMQVQVEVSRPGVPSSYDVDRTVNVNPAVSSYATGFIYDQPNYGGRNARVRIAYRDTSSGLVGPQSAYSNVITF